MHRGTTLAVAALVALSALPAAAQEAVEPLADVRISEVMQNPSRVFDSRGEWFELHNVGSDAVDLSGWTVSDDRTDSHTISGLVVPAGGRVVLGRVGDPGMNGGVVVDHVYGDAMMLRNSIDVINLVDPSGRTVDRIMWDDGVTFPDPDGASMALVDGSWCVSTGVFGDGDLGSPGRPNSCTPSSAGLVITEVLQNPDAATDGSGEWFEILNTGSAAVDLAGWTVRDEDTDVFVVPAGSVAPGDRVVLGRSADLVRNGHVAVDIVYGESIRLHNSSDELLLIDPSGVLADRVAWDDGATFPDPVGASMALSDPSLDNSVGSTWCVSTRAIGAYDLASPGSAEDCSPVVVPPIEITEILQNPMAVGDRSGEWFELANTGTEPVDLSGWTVRDDDADAHVVDGPLVVPAGGRVVLGELADPASNGGVVVDHAYGSDLVLSNASDELVLVDPTGVVVDRVAWDDGVAFPDPDGASMQLWRSPNHVGGHWCVGTGHFGDGDLGTPGGPSDCAGASDHGTVRITEIMQNPALVADDDGEWFEVWNDGVEAVDLRGWTIRDDDSDRHRIARSVVVEPGRRVLLGRVADPARNGGVELAYAFGVDVRLANGVDELVLADPTGRVVDAVRWDDGIAFPDPNGQSMALADPAGAGDGSGWCTSTSPFGVGDMGSPGSETDCRPDREHKHLQITEVMQNPASVFDSVGEWFEIHNPGPHDVDIDGWMIRDDDWDVHVIDNGGPLVVPKKGSVVLAKRGSGNGGVVADYVYGDDLILFNAADELVLLDRDRRIVDAVRWDDGATFPDPDGASMALADLKDDNAVGGNWCVSAPGDLADAGSPGSANSCAPTDCDADNHGGYVSGEAGSGKGKGGNSDAGRSDCGKPEQSGGR